MGKSEEQKLAETIAAARTLIPEIRGLQKDVQADAKALRELRDDVRDLLDKGPEEWVTTEAQTAVKIMQDELTPAIHKRALMIEDSFKEAIDLLKRQVFDGVAPEDYALVLRTIGGVLDAMDDRGILKRSPNRTQRDRFIGSLLNGPAGIKIEPYDGGGYAVQVGGDGPPDLVLDLRDHEQPEVRVTPKAQQYRDLGAIMIRQGFEKHGHNLIRSAEELEHIAATADLTFTEEVLMGAIKRAETDPKVMAQLCQLFDQFDSYLKG